MKKAFLILAYKDPDQIERLVKKMYHPQFDFHVHIDRNFSLEPFRHLSQLPNVFLCERRFKMRWASYRFVETVLFFLDQLLLEKKYDFISTFSGQDYPIRSSEEIYAYYAQRIGYSFLSIEDLGSPWYERNRRRFESFHLTYYGFRGAYSLSTLMNILLPKRSFPTYKNVYGGPRATWLTLSSDAARFLVDVVRRDKKLQRFAKYTWAPDEFLFPTILMNSPFKDRIIQDSGRYIRWKEGKSNPEILTIKDHINIVESGKLYARKFDIHVDTEILNELDEWSKG